MITKKFSFPPKCFFHARPAGVFASAASNYQSMVMLLLGTSFADGKNALSLMRLPHLRGQEFELSVDGVDEQQAIDALEKVLHQIFTE